MDQQRIDAYMIANQKFFPAEKLMLIREKLETLPEEKYAMLSAIELKDPTTMLIISIVGGSLGIDRFMLGDTGMGVVKFLTGGACGILTIMDWFTISNKTKDYNFAKLTQSL